MPTIWKSTFQEPDTSGLMDRLLGELETQEGRKVRESFATSASNTPVSTFPNTLAA